MKWAGWMFVILFGVVMIVGLVDAVTRNVEREKFREIIVDRVREEARRCVSSTIPCRLGTVGITVYPFGWIKIEKESVR